MTSVTPSSLSQGGVVSPTSPSSSKYSAPPIRNAVLKNLFPQVNIFQNHGINTVTVEHLVMETSKEQFPSVQ